MASPITKELLEHLASLSRITLTEKEETKLLKDLEGILGHFQEMEDIGAVPPEDLPIHRNAFREDGGKDPRSGKGVSNFPQAERGFLKIPPVFE
jgi:aspartyl/glutamyl-tRNA(Asn/Gln) amidotransferase C subunit